MWINSRNKAVRLRGFDPDQRVRRGLVPSQPARAAILRFRRTGRAQHEDNMDSSDTVIAVYPDHKAADAAIKQLSTAGFDVKKLSVIGKGYHSDEKVIGFYNVGDRIKLWGTRGAFWGGLWGLLFGGVLFSVPVVGHVVVLGYLAAAAISAIEGAAVIGGASALSAALFSIGAPKDSVIQYETDVQADRFLVMAHGTDREMTRAKSILSTGHPSRLNLHRRTETSVQHTRPLIHMGARPAE